MKWTGGPRFKVGDIYEDCYYHPCVAVSADRKADDISGISLIDGTSPRSCSFRYCRPPKITISNAVKRRVDWISFYTPIEKRMKESGGWDKRRNHKKLLSWNKIKHILINAGFSDLVIRFERLLRIEQKRTRRLKRLGQK